MVLKRTTQATSAPRRPLTEEVLSCRERVLGKAVS